MSGIGAAAAAARYATAAAAALGEDAPAARDGAGGFGELLSRAIEDTVATAKAADRAAAAVAGQGNVTDVVTAVARAELALQTTVAIRDRVIQAYQEVMRMPI